MTRLIVTLLFVACAPTPKHRIGVAVILDGDRAKIGKVEPHAVAGLELAPFEVPQPPPKPDDESSTVVAKARAAFVDGNFDDCMRQLEGVQLATLLAAGNRDLAARRLAFDAACSHAAQQKARAEGFANTLASLGLGLPDAPLTRDVETMISNSIAAIGKAPRHSIAFTGEVGARLFIDGRAAGCTLPCKIDLAPGEHYARVEADGFMPAERTLRVPQESAVALTQQPATPAVASEQWRARIGRGFSPVDDVGAKLLARVTGKPHVVVLRGAQRIDGTMIVKGAVEARGRDDDVPDLIRELAYDAKVLERPAIYQRPAFWIATSIAVAVVAGIVVYAVYEPDVESNLRF